MKKTINLILPLLLLLIGVHADAQKKRLADPNADGENIYRHYTGTIGGEKVVLDLRWGWQGGSNFGGSTFYYPGKEGTGLFYIYEPKTYEHDELLTADEQTDNNKFFIDYRNREEKKGSRWIFTLEGNKLAGTWLSADGKVDTSIDLKEDYSRSSAMDLSFLDDSVVTINKHGAGFAAKIVGLMVWPSNKENSEERKFNSREIMKFLCETTTQLNTRKDYINTLKAQYLAQLTTKSHALTVDSLMQVLYKEKRTRCLDINLMPVYNDNGFLVLKRDYEDDCSSTTKQHDVSFLTLDVRNKKRLYFKDVMRVNSEMLSVLLEKSARKQYKLDDAQKLSAWFLFDKIPATENFALADGGIKFFYSKGEITAVKEDPYIEYNPIELFISYKDLGDMLTKNFKKRIGM